MITAEQVTINKDKIFSNVKIYNTKETYAKGIIDYFEDSQIVIENKDGLLLLPHYSITIIRLNNSKKKFPSEISRLVKRICIAGDIVYGPCYLLDPKKHNVAGVPEIFRPYEQFTFACKDGLFITTDCHIAMVQL